MMHRPLIFTSTRLRTAGVALCLTATLMCVSLHAQGQQITTPAHRAAAQAVADSGIPVSELAANAPERHTVKRGDTLWGISGLFLKSPWRWPSLWGMNQAEITNPHLIYPGQVLVLTRSNGMAKLGLASGVDGLAEQKLLPPPPVLADQKLSPRVRSEAFQPVPISVINLNNLKHFLTQPLVVDEAGLSASGYVLTGPENRVFTAKGDPIYARALPQQSEGKYQLYRPGKPLRNPDTGQILAYEAFYLGTASLVKPGDPAQLRITDSKEEIARNDRIMPAILEAELTAVPRAPSQAIRARIMSSYNGVEFAGSNMVVTLNQGRRQGLEVGHVLALWRTGEKIVDTENPPKGFWAQFKGEKTVVQLPDEQYGTLIVFRVFEQVAYGLIVNSTLPAKVGDTVTQP